MTQAVQISLIAAMDQNHAIGRNGDLLWKLKEDLQRFKLLTIGKPVVMGRKTWDSIGKPLPGRVNIVITGDREFKADGAEIAYSFDEAIAKATEPAVSGFGEIMVIGGGVVYKEALPYASKMYLTEIEEAADEADAFFPFFNMDDWLIVNALRREGPPSFSFVDYERKVYGKVL